jgi:hypothetical protein
MRIHQDPEILRFIAPGAPPSDIPIAWRNVAIMLGHWQIRGYGPFVVVEKWAHESGDDRHLLRPDAPPAKHRAPGSAFVTKRAWVAFYVMCTRQYQRR